MNFQNENYDFFLDQNRQNEVFMSVSSQIAYFKQIDRKALQILTVSV
jgi:hypothetical protein